MTMYSASVHGLPGVLRAARLGLPLALAILVAACDVEWGGASFHLENPVPEPEATEASQPEEEVVVPLPGGPLVWAVRSTGPGGRALAMPVARMEAGVPATLDFPAPVPEGYRARFDSTFAPTGRELALGAGGVRTGTVVFSGPPRVLDAGCPSAVPARMLLVPGGSAPLVSFATPDLPVEPSQLPVAPQPDNRIRTFGPILAEQLLRQGGEDQPFLAQRADLVAVSWPGDQRPAMAATYLINDALGDDPPEREAVSLFFLARFDPGAGYVVDWSEMRTYGAGTREAFTWLEAIPGPAGRIDFAIRHDGTVRRVVASVATDGEARSIDWTEGARCPSLELLEGAGG